MTCRLALFAVAVVPLVAPASAQGQWLGSFLVPGAFEGGVTGASVNAVSQDFSACSSPERSAPWTAPG